MRARSIAQSGQPSVDQFCRLAASAPPRQLDGGIEAESSDRGRVVQLFKGVERFAPERESLVRMAEAALRGSHTLEHGGPHRHVIVGEQGDSTVEMCQRLRVGGRFEGSLARHD
jgi:hypothetical protein